MNMIVYTKRGCPWCEELVNFLNEEDVSFEEKEVRANPKYFEEMIKLSGQTLAPTVVIDKEVYADTDKNVIRMVLNTKK